PATCASMPCWSRPAACRSTSRQRSMRAGERSPETSRRAQALEERVHLPTDARCHAAEVVGDRADGIGVLPRRRRGGADALDLARGLTGALGGGLDAAGDLLGGRALLGDGGGDRARDGADLADGALDGAD